MAIPAWAKQTTLLTVVGIFFTLLLAGLIYLVYIQKSYVYVGFGISMPVVYLPILATILTAFAASAYWLVGMKFLHVALLRKLNKLEASSLNAEVEHDKVKQLQAQIHTLEAALNKAVSP